MTYIGTAQSPDSQAMEERYRRAEVLMQGYGTKSLVQNETIFSHWIVDASNTNTNCFWYERSNRVGYRSGKEYRLVDAKKRTNTFAFDHELLTRALVKASNQEVNAQNLPISHVTLTLAPVIVSFTAFDQRWQFLEEEGICQLLKSTLINGRMPAGEGNSTRSNLIAAKHMSFKFPKPRNQKETSSPTNHKLAAQQCLYHRLSVQPCLWQTICPQHQRGTL